MKTKYSGIGRVYGRNTLMDPSVGITVDNAPLDMWVGFLPNETVGKECRVTIEVFEDKRPASRVEKILMALQVLLGIPVLTMGDVKGVVPCVSVAFLLILTLSVILWARRCHESK